MQAPPERQPPMQVAHPMMHEKVLLFMGYAIGIAVAIGFCTRARLIATAIETLISTVLAFCPNFRAV